MLHKTMMFRTLEKRAKNGPTKTQGLSMMHIAKCGLDTKVNKASKAPTLWSSLQSFQFSTIFNQLLSMWICLLLTTHNNARPVLVTMYNKHQCWFYPQSRPITTNHDMQKPESRLYLATCVYFCVFVHKLSINYLSHVLVLGYWRILYEFSFHFATHPYLRDQLLWRTSFLW